VLSTRVTFASGEGGCWVILGGFIGEAILSSGVRGRDTEGDGLGVTALPSSIAEFELPPVISCCFVGTVLTGRADPEADDDDASKRDLREEMDPIDLTSTRSFPSSGSSVPSLSREAAISLGNVCRNNGISSASMSTADESGRLQSRIPWETNPQSLKGGDVLFHSPEICFRSGCISVREITLSCRRSRLVGSRQSRRA
jgi:hypothetical protein